QVGQNHPNSPREGPACRVQGPIHERPVFADGHTQTATDVLCMLTDTHGHPVCADGHPQTSCTHTDTHGRPVCADGQPQTATDLLCVLADTHIRPVCTEQIAHVGQNHPNSPREGPACRVQGPTC
ncbi:unnamed protein product, partial [Brassica rapa]